MRNFSVFSIVILCLFIVSCKDDTGAGFETQVQATPILAAKADVRASIAVESPQPIAQAGKIYTYLNYIFVNDRGEGIHVIDNANAVNPEKVAYIKVPGNYDIEVRNDILYADSYGDLVLFDVSSIDAITMIDITEDVFNNFVFSQTNHTQNFDFINYLEDFNLDENYIVGWTYESIEVEVFDGGEFLEDAAVTNGNTTGQGGSLARFKIVDDFLYVVDLSDLYVFDIATAGTAIAANQQNIGWQIETIFNQDDYLYLGSANGLFIYDISNRAQPEYTSEIQHLTGCDPVVVDGDYAYLTLRGGNTCGQQESILEVIDVSDRSNPVSVRQYAMQEPYGLGFKGDFLYVSDGRFGFQTYDKSDPENLQLVNILEFTNVFDIIPQEDRLLAIAGNTLLQYMYQGPNLNLISSYEIQ